MLGDPLNNVALPTLGGGDREDGDFLSALDLFDLGFADVADDFKRCFVHCRFSIPRGGRRRGRVRDAHGRAGAEGAKRRRRKRDWCGPRGEAEHTAPCAGERRTRDGRQDENAALAASARRGKHAGKRRKKSGVVVERGSMQSRKARSARCVCLHGLCAGQHEDERRAAPTIDAARVKFIQRRWWRSRPRNDMRSLRECAPANAGAAAPGPARRSGAGRPR